MKTLLTADYATHLVQRLLLFPCATRVRTHQMRVLHLIEHLHILQLDVQVLIDALERSADRDVVFQFYGDFVVDEGFEEAVRRRELACFLWNKRMRSG
jgi:hypothetical protein